MGTQPLFIVIKAIIIIIIIIIIINVERREKSSGVNSGSARNVTKTLTTYATVF